VIDVVPLAVLFDLDGTLIDTAPEFVAIGLQLRQAAGLPAIAPEAIRSSVSDGAMGMVAAALDMTTTDATFEGWRQRFLNDYEKGLGQHSAPYPGLPKLVSALASEGIKWGVVTNKLGRFAHPLMAKMAFDPPADVVITPDDVRHPKPHPESLILACKRLNCPPERAVFVGDHRRDIEAGSLAGCATIAAAYGYLADGESAAAWQANATANSSIELSQMIEKLLQ
jgi:phosphoglycolate phosphatase